MHTSVEVGNLAWIGGLELDAQVVLDHTCAAVCAYGATQHSTFVVV